jgi:ribosomal protein S18 acetylase RimI-like enzyme
VHLAPCELARLEVGPLTEERVREGALALAEAFMHDPGWRAIAPRRDPAARRMLRRYFRGATTRAIRFGGRVEAATRGDEVIGVAIGYGAARWPPPTRSFPHEAWGVILAGPGPTWRGLVGDSRLEAAHPAGPHAFLHTLGVDPAHQRSGAGTALVESLIARHDSDGTPIHLTTANPANLPYYRRFGFEVIGEATLPRGVPMWSMLRSALGRERHEPAEVHLSDA